jgi:peptidyl-prolyl cis-trans isomerase C
MMSGPVVDQAPSAREFNELLLQQYINRLLLWQEAVALGISVSDSLVQAFFLDYQEAMGGKDVISQALESVGIGKDDVIQSIQRDLVIRSFLETHFMVDTTVEENEVLEFYNQNMDQIRKPDSVRARHILLVIRPGERETSKKLKWEKIQNILGEVKAGGDFAALAEQYSEGPSKDRGGDLGYFQRGAMVQPFDSAAFALEIGEVSGVVKTIFGYHIIKLEDKKLGRILPFAEVSDSLMSMIGQSKLASRVQNHLKEMRSLAIIEKNY